MIVEIEMMLSGLPACYSIGGVPVSMARWSESMIIVVVEMEQLSLDARSIIPQV